MSNRILVVAAAASVLLLVGCDEGSEKHKQASMCKGLNEADCTANAECSWVAEKGKCWVKKADQMAPDQSAPADESAPPAAETPAEPQSAPPASETPAEPPQ
jgi:uncharacterized lipoprotein NlpE involved in copper resistance